MYPQTQPYINALFQTSKITDNRLYLSWVMNREAVVGAMLLLSGSLVSRTIVYTYDNLYRLITTTYTTGERYAYKLDPVGNRLKQIINGNTTTYLYDAANRLSQVNGQSYTFDNNGNLKLTGAMTNTFDAANRLISANRNGLTVQPIYNGIGDRVGQTVGTTTTHFALDVEGLPEVIYTSAGEIYLHLLGVIVTKKGSEVRYLLSDGLGSIRQAVDENRVVVAYNEFDPYGNPVNNIGGEPYGYTGEWWQDEVSLLHLRARWYLVETGTFLSRDPIEGEPPYLYVRGNPINRIDPTGFIPNCEPEKPCNVIIGAKEIGDRGTGGLRLPFRHAFILVADPNRQLYPELNLGSGEPPIFDPQLDPSKQLPNLMNDSSTVYFFRGGSSRPNRFSPWGYLEAKYGYYREFNPDGTPNLDYLPIHVKYVSIAETTCAEKLRCFKSVMDQVNTRQLPYWPDGINSNTTVSGTLRRCGLPAENPFPTSLWLTSWRLSLDIWSPPTPLPPSGPATPTPTGTPPPGRL